MKYIVFANQKGGAGKSTMSINLAEELTKFGSVLFVDADISQDSSTKMIERMDEVHDFLREQAAEKDADPDDVPYGYNFQPCFIPKSPRHAQMTMDEVAIYTAKYLERIAAELGPSYDYVVVDTPGDSGTVIPNSIKRIADLVIVPTDLTDWTFQTTVNYVTGLSEDCAAPIRILPLVQPQGDRDGMAMLAESSVGALQMRSRVTYRVGYRNHGKTGYLVSARPIDKNNRSELQCRIELERLCNEVMNLVALKEVAV